MASESAVFLNFLLGRRATFVDSDAASGLSTGTIMAVTLPIGRVPSDLKLAIRACLFTIRLDGKDVATASILYGVPGSFIDKIDGLEGKAIGAAPR